MDEEFEASKPARKISEAEAILVFLALCLVSLINLIPVVGDITSFLDGGFMFFYLYQKGLFGADIVATNLVAYICGFIPILQAFPTEPIAWIVTVIIAWNPKLEVVAEKVGDFEELGEGELGEAGTEDAGKKAAAGSTASESSAGVDTAETNPGELGYESQEHTAGSKNGKPSETSTERGQDVDSSKNTIGENEEDENTEAADKLRLGDEIPPTEQMEEQDFGSLQDVPNTKGEDEEEKEQDGRLNENAASPNEVVDIAAARARQNRKQFVADKIPQEVTEGTDDERDGRLDSLAA